MSSLDQNITLKAYVESLIDGLAARLDAHIEHDQFAHDRMEERIAERIRALERLLAAGDEANQRAIIEAKNNVDSKFSATNEWRDTYGDLVRSNVSSGRFEEFSKAVQEFRESVNTRLSAREGEQKGTRYFWAQIIALAVAAGGIASIISFGIGHLTK